MSDKKSKAELLEMLAEAVRNTQPQPVNTQREPVREAQPEPKRNSRARKRPAPKRMVKIKSGASRKRQHR